MGAMPTYLTDVHVMGICQCHHLLHSYQCCNVAKSSVHANTTQNANGNYHSCSNSRDCPGLLGAERTYCSLLLGGRTSSPQMRFIIVTPADHMSNLVLRDRHPINTCRFHIPTIRQRWGCSKLVAPPQSTTYRPTKYKTKVIQACTNKYLLQPGANHEE